MQLKLQVEVKKRNRQSKLMTMKNKQDKVH